ncbi:hypothetical protein C6503_18185 [Candidatus Poribacteria bacterium]|nr:MAG: hypothetical protein C6503_18185 [Candidatus Poribacteria bacterium]
MIFVDTGGWIAILNRRDQHHQEAVTIFNTLQQQQMHLLTTDTRLRYDTNHSIAVMFLNRIELLVETGVLTIAEIDRDMFEKAKAFFRQYDSARLSFTDCTSFVVCQENNIFETFAFDQHFSIMGIQLLR